MHEAAVVALCLVALVLIRADAALLFLEWYSGVDPPLGRGARIWLWFRMVFAGTACAVALATL